MKIICKTVVTLAVVGLAGCVSVEETFTASGEKGYTVNCSGSGKLQGWNKCYAKAGELCRARGYEILEKIDKENEFTSVDIFSGTLERGTRHTRNLVIRCKESFE